MSVRAVTLSGVEGRELDNEDLRILRWKIKVLRWKKAVATKVLRDYLLKGYAFQHKIEKIEKQVIKQGEQIELLVQSTLPPKEGFFFEGQIFDAYHFASQIIKSAKKSCILIDN